MALRGYSSWMSERGTLGVLVCCGVPSNIIFKKHRYRIRVRCYARFAVHVMSVAADLPQLIHFYFPYLLWVSLVFSFSRSVVLHSMSLEADLPLYIPWGSNKTYHSLPSPPQCLVCTFLFHASSQVRLAQLLSPHSFTRLPRAAALTPLRPCRARSCAATCSTVLLC